MDLIQSVKAFLTAQITQSKIFLSPQVQDIGRPPVYPKWDIQTYINAYNTNATIYTLVSFVTEKFGSIVRYTYTIQDNEATKSYKYYIKRKGHKSKKQIKDLKTKAYGETVVKPSGSSITGDPEERLAALTDRPNDDQGQDSYYAEALFYYLLTGESFILLNRGDIKDATGRMKDPKVIARMPVLEKKVLPAHKMTIIPSRQDINTIILYKFEDYPGHFVEIPPVNMIHWRTINPNYDGTLGTHLRGLAPLAAGLKLLTQDNAAIDAAVAMQQNQGAKGVLYNENLSSPTPVQGSAIQGVIDTKINNTAVKGAVATLGMGKWGYLDMGQTAIDLQLLQSQQSIFIRLCNLFGVPPAIWLTETTYENLQQAMKSLLTNKILPLASSFRDEENRVLIPAFGLDPNKITTDVDATMIPELSEDMAALTVQLSQSTWLTPNEKREAVGEEPDEDPSMDKHYIQNNYVAIEDLTVNDGLDSFDPNSGAVLSDPVDNEPPKKS